MQQHAEPIGGLQPARLRRREQRRHQRDIDKIGNNRRLRQQAEIDVERGIKRVHLVNRTMERAEVLAEQFGPCVHPVTWDAIAGLLPRAGLLVNTTSLGMHGQPALELDVALLPQHAVVADLVYVPLETPLLWAAKAHGLKIADGLGMLLHQAVRGFELWFGQRPQVTSELRALVEADLTRP